MQFYRKSKDGQNYFVLHTQEWNRLKKQSAPATKPLNDQKEYVKSLNEKSRAWTKTWADHQHGVLANYEKKQQKIRETRLAIVALDKERQTLQKQSNSIEAIKEARQKIFDESCYGRKLLSALRESKTLEERDEQVKFLKELKEKRVIETKKFKISQFCSFDLDKHKVAEELCRKATTRKMALQNKEIYEKQKAEIAKARQALQQDELDNIRMISEMLALEHKAEEKVKLLAKEAMEQNMDDDKKSKEERARLQANYYAKVLNTQKEKEDLSCKINQVLKEMYKTRDLPCAKQVYENLKQNQEEKRKSLEKFVEINNELAMTRSEEKERKDKEKEIKNREERQIIIEANKLKVKCKKKKEYIQGNQFSADRQSLIVNSDYRKRKDEYEKKPPQFGSCNRLMSALKKRIQQSPSWTGANTAHREFARNANDILGDCKYKQYGRKVVDEYIKYNRLKSLDVQNYF